MRLDLSDQPNFQVKISTLQEYLVSTFYVHQQSFLNQKNETTDSVRQLFHFLLEGNVLSLYIFPTSIVKDNNSACKVSELVSGNIIRCVIRLQGISQIRNKYGSRLRLQHSIPSCWLIPLA